MLRRAGDDLTPGDGGEDHSAGGAGYGHIHPDGTPKQAPDTRTQVAKGGYVPPGKTANRAGYKGLGVHVARRVLWPLVAMYTTRPKTAR